jgi:hypothetical protein
MAVAQSPLRAGKPKPNGSANKRTNVVSLRKRPFSPLDKEAWLRLAGEWLKLAQAAQGKRAGS